MTQQDIDLQKIQVLESTYQGWFNFRALLGTGGFIALVILSVTLEVEKILTMNWFVFVYFLAILVGFYNWLDTKRNHNQHITFISNLIVKIEKGEPLDSIAVLDSTKSNLKASIKNNANLFATCVFISLVIAITQIVSSAVQTYFIDNNDPFSRISMLIFIIFLYGVVIFILVKVSSQFRNFLLRMFGVQQEKEKSETQALPKT